MTRRETGLDLKLERVAAGIRAQDVARVMGVSTSRLSRIEKPEPVTAQMADRYREALATCRTSGTSSLAGSAA